VRKLLKDDVGIPGAKLIGQGSFKEKDKYDP
jgi:hypothetical protein